MRATTAVLAGVLTLTAGSLQAQDPDGSNHGCCEPPKTIVEAEDRLLEGLDRLTRLREVIDPAQFDVAAKAAALGANPMRLFYFVRDEITYEPYPGSLRGARGALVCRAGNSVDQSLLLQGLLRVHGHEARLVHGSLTPEGVALLTEQSTYPVLGGRLPEFAQLLAEEGFGERQEHLRQELSAKRKELAELLRAAEADRLTLSKALAGQEGAERPPAALAALNEGVRLPARHTWVQLKRGETWLDLDPSVEEQPPGQRIAKELPGAVEHQQVLFRVRIEQLDKELKITTILEQDFDTAELLGAAITFGSVPGGPKAEEPTRFLPMLIVDGKPYTKQGFDLRGNLYDKDEFATKPAVATFAETLKKPLRLPDLFGGGGNRPASQPTKQGPKLTAVWLDIIVKVPGREDRVHSRALLDRLGPGARTAKKNVAKLSDDDLRDRLSTSSQILVEPGFLPEAFLVHRMSEQLLAQAELMQHATQEAFFAAEDPKLEPASARWAVGSLESLSPELVSLGAGVQRLGEDLQAKTGAKVYRPTPGVALLKIELERKGKDEVLLRRGFDIVTPGLGVAAADGKIAAQVRLSVGVALTHFERLVANECLEGLSKALAGDPSLAGRDPPKVRSAIDALEAARGGEWTVLRPGDRDALAGLTCAEQAKARIRDELDRGDVVVLPTQNAVAWWRVDRDTGVVLGIAASGEGQSMAERVQTAIVTRFLAVYMWAYNNPVTLVWIQVGVCVGSFAAGYLSGSEALDVGSDIACALIMLFQGSPGARVRGGPPPARPPPKRGAGARPPTRTGRKWLPGKGRYEKPVEALRRRNRARTQARAERRRVRDETARTERERVRREEGAARERRRTARDAERQRAQDRGFPGADQRSDDAAKKVLEAMEGTSFGTRNPKAVQTLVHEDGTVTVSVSGSGPRHQAKLDKLQAELDRTHGAGRYRVASADAPPGYDPKEPPSGVTAHPHCAEPKGWAEAQKHDSPVVSMTVTSHENRDRNTLRNKYGTGRPTHNGVDPIRPCDICDHNRGEVMVPRDEEGH